MNESKEASKETKAIIPIGSRGIELSTFDQLWNFSKIVVEAGLAPKSIDTPAKVFLAIQYSMEMGFSPMIGLQNAMVINNRVSFYGDLVVGQVINHPDFEDMQVDYEGEQGPSLTCIVTLKRKGMSPSVGRFSIQEAQHLINDPAKAGTWGRYPRRMLFFRAFSRAKIIFSDATKGITMQSDLDDDFEPRTANVLSITKPEFENEKDNVTRGEMDAVSGTEQSDERSEGGGGPTPGVAKAQDGGTVAQPEKPSERDSEESVQGDPAPRSETVAKGPLTKAERLLKLINADGWTQVQVIGLLAAFGAATGEALESGVVADLPELTLNAALQQWETIKFNLAK